MWVNIVEREKTSLQYQRSSSMIIHKGDKHKTRQKQEGSHDIKRKGRERRANWITTVHHKRNEQVFEEEEEEVEGDEQEEKSGCLTNQQVNVIQNKTNQKQPWRKLKSLPPKTKHKSDGHTQAHETMKD